MFSGFKKRLSGPKANATNKVKKSAALMAFLFMAAGVFSLRAEGESVGYEGKERQAIGWDGASGSEGAGENASQKKSRYSRFKSGASNQWKRKKHWAGKRAGEFKSWSSKKWRGTKKRLTPKHKRQYKKHRRVAPYGGGAPSSFEAAEGKREYHASGAGTSGMTKEQRAELIKNHPDWNARRERFAEERGLAAPAA